VKAIRAHLASLLTFLNYVGSILLAYALANPGAFAELKALLPPSLQPWSPVLALGWFALVQYAKMRALRPKPQ
jgi:hypothetical protein